MAIESKTLLKSYFNHGDTPTEQQFADLIDSFAHVDDLSSMFETPKVESNYPSVSQTGKFYANLDATGSYNGGQVVKFSCFCSAATNLHLITFTDDGDGTVTILSDTSYSVVVGLNEIPLSFTGLTASVLVGYYTDVASVKYRTPAGTNVSGTGNIGGTGYALRDHEFAYWLTYEVPGAELPEKVNVGTGNVEILNQTDLQELINNNRYLVLPDGNISLASSVTIPSNTTIVGGRNTVLNIASGITGLIIDGSNVSLKGIKIDGGGGTSVTNTTLTTDAQIGALTGVGTQVGIRIQGAFTTQVVISDCFIENVNGRGVQVDASHNSYQGNVTMSDLHIYDCHVGLCLEEAAEYGNYTNIRVSRTWVGIAVFGGNNYFVNCNCSGNRIGVLIGGGSNNAHAGMANTAINHSTLWGIWYGNVTKGYTFVGCHTHDSDFRLFNCDAFLFSSGMVGGKFVMGDCRFAHIIGCVASGNLAYDPFVVEEDSGTTNVYAYTNNYYLDGSAVVHP